MAQIEDNKMLQVDQQQKMLSRNETTDVVSDDPSYLVREQMDRIKELKDELYLQQKKTAQMVCSKFIIGI